MAWEIVKNSTTELPDVLKKTPVTIPTPIQFEMPRWKRIVKEDN